MGQNIIGDSSVKIADSVEAEVAAGRLKAGDRLPPVRELADTLGVNRNTVSAAYRRLAAAGIVVSAGRRGTRVASAPPVAPLTSVDHTREGVRRLDVGGPDPAFLPDLVPFLRRIEPPARSYGEETNLASLLEVGRRYFEADGLKGGRLSISSGALDGLERILQVHLRPGDAVGLEDPGFLAGAALVRSLGFNPVPVAIDEKGPLPDAVARAMGQRIRALIMTPRAQNPTGACLSRERAADLREIVARDPRLLLVEDDHGGPIAGAEPISVAHDHAGPWAILRSLGKFLGPDLRLGFVLGDEATIARFEGHLALGMRWVSHVLQHLVVEMWGDRAVQQQIRRAAKAYHQRRVCLLEALQRHGIEATGSSGLNVWVPVARETLVVQRLSDMGWAVAAGEGFRLAAGPAIRVTTSMLARDESERFAADLATILRPGVQSTPV